MRVLLDTHAFPWYITSDVKLSPAARAAVVARANEPVLSAASGWEIATKYAIGKLPLPEGPGTDIPRQMALNGIVELPITNRHALHTHSLPMHHRDPFDRIIVAQSLLEGLQIVTADPVIAQYGAATIW